MLKQNWIFIARLQRIGDVLIVFLSFLMAYYSREAILYWNESLDLNLPFRGEKLAPLKDNFIVLVVGLLGYQIFLTVLGAYNSMRLMTPWQLFWITAFSSVLVFFTLAASLYLLKIDLSRSFIGLFCLYVCFVLSAERFLVLRFLRFYRRKGMNFRNILICGIGKHAIKLAGQIASMPELGLWVRGFVVLKEQGENGAITEEDFKLGLRAAGFNHPIKIFYGAESLQKALLEYAVDEVIFTDVVDVMPVVEEMVMVCSEQGVRTTLVADLFSIGLVKSGISYFGDMPLIHFQTPPGDRWELALKRGIDLILSAILLLILSPVFLLIALAIYLESGKPILFIQKRVGLNGRLFDLIKFRSMQVDADKKLEELMSKNEMSGPIFKMTNDPRVTRVGKWLRKFSLDELPQLWNVLVGQMSLVGPRPPIPGEVSLYERSDRRRLSMRPGITCTWQVSGRNEISDFDKWVKLDLEYIDNWSLRRDLYLLAKTIPAVLFAKGAR